jgi:hypothetical protein
MASAAEPAGASAAESAEGDEGGDAVAGAGGAGPPTLYSIGHSTRSTEQLVSMLKEHGVRLLVDIRTVPKSRRARRRVAPALKTSRPCTARASTHNLMLNFTPPYAPALAFKTLHTHTRTHARTRTRAHARTHARTHTHTHAHAHAHTRTHARTHTHTHAHTHTRTHAHTHTRAHSH